MRVQPCGLTHERVLIDARGVRRRAAATEMDAGLERAGLCSHALRARQLSCAHTRARLTLDKAIEAAAVDGMLSHDEAQRLRAELRRIDHAIHMADWAKSRAEAEYAQQVETGAPSGSAVSRQRCEQLAERHAGLSAELGALHAGVLERLGSSSTCRPLSEHPHPPH